MSMTTDSIDPCDPPDPRVTQVCFGAEAPYGTRVEDTAWGTLVGLAGGNEGGSDHGARDLGERSALHVCLAAREAKPPSP
jgi:hypothetical protein